MRSTETAAGHIHCAGIVTHRIVATIIIILRACVLVVSVCVRALVCVYVSVCICATQQQQYKHTHIFVAIIFMIERVQTRAM